MSHFPYQIIPSEWEGYTQRRREREQEQREQVEELVIDWLRSQYGPLPVYRYSPHDTPPAPPEGHFRIGRDGTVTPTAPWNRDNQNE